MSPSPPVSSPASSAQPPSKPAASGPQPGSACAKPPATSGPDRAPTSRPGPPAPAPRVLVMSLAEGSSIRDCNAAHLTLEQREAIGTDLLCFMFWSCLVDRIF